MDKIIKFISDNALFDWKTKDEFTNYIYEYANSESIEIEKSSISDLLDMLSYKAWEE